VTLFLDFRSQPAAGSVQRLPAVYEMDLAGAGLTKARWRADRPLAGGRDRHILFATHGFNVSGPKGQVCLIRLQRTLNLDQAFLFVGVLWPGDWHVPVINYPAEGKDAAQCGDNLAAAAKALFPEAQSASFLSHSLGGRVVLQAVKGFELPVGQVCLAAPAVDRACLGPGKAYDAVRGKVSRITVIASDQDRALGAVYAAGSLGGALLGDKHPFGLALGREGASPRPLPPVVNTQIPSDQKHGHGDYFPPSKPGEVNQRADRSMQVMASALSGAAADWPHKGRIHRDPAHPLLDLLP
jgi:hypothetical protein